MIGDTLTLEFSYPELIAVIAASSIATLVAVDGKSNWLEGAMQLAAYGKLALAFFFLSTAF
jgi:Ca2+:H+ antiporter